MPIVGRALLIAVGRALGAVHIEDDDLRLLAFMNPVDPDPREVGQDRQVRRRLHAAPHNRRNLTAYQCAMAL